MSRKRRMFDIELPYEALGDFPAGKSDGLTETHEAKIATGQRRGPMATAIGETGDALRHRKALEADIRAENDALAHEFVRLKKSGLVVDLVPLDLIDASKLTRDRSQSADLDLADLKASLRDIGLSNPIRVEPSKGGRFELVEGMRRLSAYRELLAETQDDRWARIPAGLLVAGGDEAALYRRMVDENMVRKDISFAEMAQLALAYADSHVGGCADVDEAVNRLYASAAPQKRTYIRRFAMLLRRTGGALSHPAAIPRALGLRLADLTEGDPDFMRNLTEKLRLEPDRNAEKELAILRDAVDSRAEVRTTKPRGRPAGRRGRVVLSVPVGPGVRCTAADGKMELRAEMDFSAVERSRLERAVEAFFGELGGR